MDLIDAIKTFPDELACVKYLEKMRWPDGVKCVKCGSDQVTFYTKREGVRARVNQKGEKVESRVPTRYIYQCKACRHQFTPTVGTLFNDTHLPLRTWFLTVALLIGAKKSMAANQVKRHLGIGSYRTAWYLCHRVRRAMEELPEGLFKGVVEADETYIGGKCDRRLKRDRWDKEPVFGVIERKGKVRTWHIPHVNRYHVIGKLTDTVSPDVELVCTDESRLYDRMPGEMKHEIVNHSAKEWVRGIVHTSAIDGYWGLLKRAIIGSFHHVSIKHLDRSSALGKSDPFPLTKSDPDPEHDLARCKASSGRYHPRRRRAVRLPIIRGGAAQATRFPRPDLPHRQNTQIPARARVPFST